MKWSMMLSGGKGGRDGTSWVPCMSVPGGPPGPAGQ